MKTKSNAKHAQENQKKIIDWDLVYRHFVGDEDILADVMKGVLLSMPTLMTDIKKHIENKDGPKLEVAAHTLKGSISHFFAKDLCASLAELENCGRTGHFEGTSKLYDVVERDLRDLGSELTNQNQRRKAV